MRLRLVKFILAVLLSSLLCCKGTETNRSNKSALLNDESCRDLLQQVPERIDPAIQRPLKIRREEDYEEQLSSVAPRGSIPFYLYKISSRKAVVVDGYAFESIFAVDRRSGIIHELFGKKNDPSAFNSVVAQSDLAIDLPDKAIAIADLYETLTQDPRFSFVQDETQLVAEVADYYDPKHLHRHDAQKRTLQVLNVKDVSDLNGQFRPKATRMDGGYAVSLAIVQLDTSEPNLKLITLKVQGNGTVSDVAISTVALLDKSPWCKPSVFDRCEAER